MWEKLSIKCFSFLRTCYDRVYLSAQDEAVLTSAGATAKQGSLQVSHAAAAKLIGGLEDLKSNHSNVMEAREEAKTALDTALKNHTQIKRQIADLKAVNDRYQRQTEALETEKASLKANYTALSEAEMLMDGLILSQMPPLTDLSFFQRKAVAVPHNGSISTPLAIYFRMLPTAVSKWTGMTAEWTAPGAEPTWSSSTPQRSRLVKVHHPTPSKNQHYVFFVFWFLFFISADIREPLHWNDEIRKAFLGKLLLDRPPRHSRWRNVGVDQ